MELVTGYDLLSAGESGGYQGYPEPTEAQADHVETAEAGNPL